MDSMKLREICTRTKVGRRTIQGYEKAGLVRATGKNKYGHLLYDKKAEERIKEVYFYQQIGFPVKEIYKVIDSDRETKKALLTQKLEVLEERSKNLERLIAKTREILQSL